ncbi:MAG: FecR domain-containing protein [Spirochaetia bacterium]|jgi:hypothetical protein|nr:FecR domain-containing protein [Spirochaetia bacterium]
MKKYLLIFVIAAACVSASWGEAVATVSYIDGWVDIKDSSGRTSEAFSGDELSAGNSVITGKDSFAELLEKSGSTYKISPETIFTVREMDVKGKKQNVLALTLGEVAFKFKKVASEEPMIATNSTVAGIRGTEFTVYAGADGSTLIAVASGLVEVEAAGKSVELNPDEAVEVKPGDPPGEKFQLLGKKLDFSTWNDGKKKDFLENPVAALEAVEKRLDYFNGKVLELHPVYLEWAEQLKEDRKEFAKIQSEKGQNEALEFREKVMSTSLANTINLSLNVRYYALSSLSMRRFILGNMYAEIKTRFMTKLDDPVYREFENVYKRVLEKFEDTSIPQINETDI